MHAQDSAQVIDAWFFVFLGLFKALVRITRPNSPGVNETVFPRSQEAPFFRVRFAVVIDQRAGALISRAGCM